MKNKIICAGVMCILGIMCVLMAKEKPLKKQILGIWYEDGDPDLYCEFNEDGTVYENDSGVSYNWHLTDDDSTLVISFSVFSLDYHVKMKGNSMTWTNSKGKEHYFTRNVGTDK